MNASANSDQGKTSLKFRALQASTAAEFKRKVTMFAERHGNVEAQRAFGVPESNIRRWKKAHLLSRTFEGRTRRIVKKIDGANRDFVYELARLDPLKKIRIDSSLLSRLTENNGVRTPSASSPKLKVIMKQPTLVVPKTPAAPPESDTEEVCLRWNSHHNNMKSYFPSLLQREQYVDVTLASEGKTLKCHRLILSSCSTYFDEILSGISPFQHPVIFVNGVEFWTLKLLIDFMYAGEVHIEQNKLPQLLKVAQMLQVKGLTGKTMSAGDDGEGAQPNVKVEDEAKKEPPAPQKQQQPPPKTLKLIPASVITAVDPLALLKPTFIEESPESSSSSSKTKEQHPKKVVSKKMRKRKPSEHEASPPPILFRKGTKSRPNVKVPRYYHNDYENVKATKQEESNADEAAYDLNKVKSEPLDIEDTDVVGFARREDDDEKSSERHGGEEEEALRGTPDDAGGNNEAGADCEEEEEDAAAAAVGGDDVVKKEDEDEDETGNNNVAK